MHGVWEHLKPNLVLAVVTVFIWMAADRNVREERSFQVPVRLVAHESERYAALAEPPYQAVLEVKATGSRRQLKEFADLVNSKPIFEAVADESRASSSEPQAVSSEADIFKNIKELQSGRVLIKSISPQTLSVLIDDYETVRNVAVEPDFGDLKVVADVSPAKVSVRLPRFAARLVQKDPVFRPKVEQRIRDARQPDNAFAFKAPVSFEFENLDPRNPVKVSPTDEITITGRIESRTETRRKGPIQITWSIPDEVQAAYVVAVKPGENLRRDIEVTGPRGQVEQLPLQKIRGFVDVMAADEPNKEITRAIRYVLPEGFALASDQPEHEITFTLTPRAATGGSGT